MKSPIVQLSRREIINRYPNIAKALGAELRKAFPAPGSIYEPTLAPRHAEQATCQALSCFGSVDISGGNAPADVLHFPSTKAGPVRVIDVKTMKRCAGSLSEMVLTNANCNSKSRLSARKKMENLFETYTKKISQFKGLQYSYLCFINDPVYRTYSIGIFDIFPQYITDRFIRNCEITPSGKNRGCYVTADSIKWGQFYCSFAKGRLEFLLRPQFAATPENLLKVYSY